MNRRIAIIPARGGSKRIAKKNIKIFNGRPMISYILQTAKDTNLFDTIHVSTEDPEIMEVVEKLGVKIDFLRPKNLADDHTPLLPVLKYVVETYLDRGEKFDEVWLLMACSPLIESADLIKASERYATQQEQGRPVLAVAEYPAPIEWAFEMSTSGDLSPLEEDKHIIRSQDLTLRYYDSGTFIIFPTSYILNPTTNSQKSKFIGYVLPKIKGIDIDTSEDWNMAELIYKAVAKLKCTQ